MGELRAYRRWELGGKAILRTDGESPQTVRGELYDLSFSGVGLVATETLPIGTQVSVDIIADAHRIGTATSLGRGEIACVAPAKGPGNPQRIGVRLVAPDAKLMDELLLLLQQLAHTRRGTSTSKVGGWRG